MKMMNEYQMKLEEGNKVTLPESLVNKLLLRKGGNNGTNFKE